MIEVFTISLYLLKVICLLNNSLCQIPFARKTLIHRYTVTDLSIVRIITLFISLLIRKGDMPVRSFGSKGTEI